MYLKKSDYLVKPDFAVGFFGLTVDFMALFLASHTCTYRI